MSKTKTPNNNKKTSIGPIAIELMKAENISDKIDIGSFGLCDEIFAECVKRGVIKSKKYKHPLDRQVYIMSQLRKSKLFKKVGNISYPGMRGYGNCTVLQIVTK